MSHHHGHTHGHGDAHGHSHAPDVAELAAAPDHRRKLRIAVGLTLVMVLAQAVGAWVTGSLAQLVDMVHSIVDSSGLMIALVAATLMMRPPDRRRTWGFRRVEVLAALGQACLLIGISVYALIEAWHRWIDPPVVQPLHLLGFAVLGLALNLAALMVLTSSRSANFNMRAAFLEVAMDALGTLAIMVSAIVMWATGFHRADTIAAVVIAALILPRAAVLIRDTMHVLMEFTPRGLDLDEVREHILRLDHVREVHDLHATTVATGLPTLSCHVVVEDECFHDGHSLEILEKVSTCVAEHFDVSIEHSTFQLESVSFRDNETARHP